MPSETRPFEITRAENATRPIAATMMDVPLRITDILKRSEKLFANSEIVTRTGHGQVSRMTYAELGNQARRLATALNALDVARGARVATLMWNHAEHMVAYYGIPAAQAVLHTLNPRLSAKELAYVIADAGDDIIIIDEDLLPLWREVEQFITLRHVIVNGRADQPSDLDLVQLLRTHKPMAEWPEGPFDETTAAAICYTSGTTGRPKGVVYSHRSSILHALGSGFPDSFNLSYRSVAFPLTPMFHVNAWGVPFSAVMSGSTIVLPGAHIQAGEILDLMAAEQVTISFGVPTIWAGVLEQLEANPKTWILQKDLVLGVGGAAPPPDMIRGFDRHGITLQTGWGMTETSPIASQTWLKKEQDNLDYDSQITIRASQGLPLPFVEYRIAQEDGTILPWNSKDRGELQVRGPWITAGYIGHPEHKSAVTADGWLRTGDVAVMHPDGRLQLVDRLKDLIKSGGEWISSVDMENVISDLPEVAEVAIIALADAHWGERPMAVIRPSEDKRVTVEMVRTHLLTHYPKWMVPDRYEIVDAIPRTGTGKMNKVLLRQTYDQP